MKSIKELMERFKWDLSDVVGLDLDSGVINAVRMRKSNNQISVFSVGVLSDIDFSVLSQKMDSKPFVIPPKLKARYASIAVSGDNTVIKLLNLPGNLDSSAEEKIVTSMGLDNPDEYRIGYKLISEGHGKSESKVLAVAMPEVNAIVTNLLPVGLPAPLSLEISGLATITAFLNAYNDQHKDDAVGVINFGTKITTFALFSKNVLVLIRQLNIGSDAILANVQESLGVDRETAQGIFSDGSFDISQSVSEVMAPLIKQLILSRDFVERRENCHISKIYVSGGLAVSHDSINEMNSSLGIEIDFWNPFRGLTLMQDALPDEFSGREWQFSAAVGACIASFEES